ncbi:MAG: DegT/DnrJ/EryC1/StrS family aminotransferase [Desulfobacteraceae bacterium]|nr:DegT/DnrJ/EryC1/StrS family aminotransferase [Desulfobacteraceae bacterium]
MKVPFIDLKAQYVSIKNDIEEAVAQAIDSCAFAGGPFVEKFEKSFAQFCGCEYAIGVGSGTEAIWLSLLALGIGRGDEVITVPNSFIATAEAISFSGAKPVFVDIDETTCNIDVRQLVKAITPNTKAIIPVHLYGQMSDMDQIINIANQHDLFVIEDACQAHGATYRDQKAGTMGVTGCFSFYPGKNLGAYGDAGAVVTNDANLAQIIRYLRDHGQTAKYEHKAVGWNARMDGIQGAILDVKLKHLASWNYARGLHAAYYNRQLEGLDGIRIPEKLSANSHVYHIYSIFLENRDDVMEHLISKGVHCGIHYPIPIHLQPAYRQLNLAKGSFPRAELNSQMQLSLPMYPELKEEQIAYVVKTLEACLMPKSKPVYISKKTHHEPQSILDKVVATR